MTKAELIRKIAKQSGVPDTEAKLFFEIFLRKAAGITEPGDALLVPEFGYFLPKKGKMNISNFEGEKQDVFLDLIVFKPSKDEKLDNLIFNVPEANTNGSKQVDSYFSLSIGKPVIPLQGVKDVDFFLPPSGNELRRLIESKIEKIIDESEVIKNFKSGNDVILINKDEFDQSQLEMNYTSLNQTEEYNHETDSEIDIEDSIDFNEVNWNSSRDLSKEIEEESLLDTGKDYDSVFEEETSGLSWNFGNIPDENYYSPKTGTEAPQAELKSEENNIEDNSINSGSESYSENQINDETGLNDSDLELNSSSIIDEKKSENKIDVDDLELKNEESKKNTTRLSYEEKLLRERKSYTWVFILIVLLIIAAAYFFLSSMNKKHPAANLNSTSNNITENNTEEPKIEAAANKGNDNNPDKLLNENLKDFPKNNIEKISDNIFKYGSVFVVQVSSWKTKEKAVHQVDLFNSTGRNAFLEEAKVSGTVWYRVRVGNFNSLAEAKQFLNKN